MNSNEDLVIRDTSLPWQWRAISALFLRNLRLRFTVARILKVPSIVHLDSEKLTEVSGDGISDELFGFFLII